MTVERLYRGKPVRRMHVMVKPTGSLCNLDCTYCYYLSKKELLGSPEQWRISDDVLETFIRQYFEAHNHKEVVFSWQGGEPTLLGLDFFKKVVELEKKYCLLTSGAKTTCRPTVQTLMMRGASSCGRSVSLWAYPSMVQNTCTTPIAETRADRGASTGSFGPQGF